jgi:hypothetical protein
VLANRLAERLGLPPGGMGIKAEDYSPEKVAGRILGFIEQRQLPGAGRRTAGVGAE